MRRNAPFIYWMNLWLAIIFEWGGGELAPDSS
jgi:hypothetical protein